MATERQIQAGIETLADYEFRYLDLLKADTTPVGSDQPNWVGCVSSYPERRADFVAKMLARSHRCEASEASWRQVGQELDLLCDNPYADFEPSHLAAEWSRCDDRLRGTLYVFDHTGPCGLADFSVRLDSLDFLPGIPQFFLSLDCIYLSEDRRGEGLGAELAVCAADAMLRIVTDVAKNITRRGRVELTFQSEVISISGWVAAWFAAGYLAERIGAKPSGYAQGRLQSRPVTLECFIED